ncbi:MerR family transcriptional regulator [Streptococcus macacae]|uniref:HTH-type transcriptional regulator CueR family protein n=1 Tax=Streptococcus macacae NCTC 11558 TaxID=764298 RepID=G5JUN8_9STRE|nr:MerR family transcriptional regulator [Streptococcus macacae]EHJ52978.1 HTH-type transcriptional regulator CueR family protein [Streptococcus macacae NCTC 11558]SUN78854.1 MerR family transcriptional regulator [Streptococcus macacae NCTC 11558]
MKTIKDIAAETGLSAHTIRFYEKEGLVTIPRNENGIRYFDEASVDTLKSIAHYRNVGMSLEDIRQIMKEFHNHQLSTQLLKRTLPELDLQIAELTATRDFLIEKIGIHQHLADLQAQGYSEQERYEAYLAIRKEQEEKGAH